MSSSIVNDKTENNKSVVLGQDDAWVVCESRSRPGLKYYVNKFSGIKVWNITEDEIELAKKFGEDSAEPAGLPPMERQTNFYNKQIISNQFSNPLPSLLINPTPFINADRDHSQGDLLPQIQTQQCYTLVPTDIAPLINQLAANASLQQPYQQLYIPSNNLNLPGSIPQYAQRQQYFSNKPLNKNQRFRKNKWFRNRNLQGNNLSSQNASNNTSDLRQKLVRKRRFSESYLDHKQDDYDEEEPMQNNNKFFKSKAEHELQETSTRLDLTPLKEITASKENSDMYIVIDKSTILNNYNYLNNMIGSDVNCQLLIPFHVVTELKKHASDSRNVQTRRILRFLSQQIESGLIKVGLKDETEAQGSYKTLLTCVNLSMQYNNVVLISNDDDILKNKHNQHGIHIYTIEEIKDILARKPIRPRADSPTLAIKITVPNTLQNTEKERDSPRLSAQINPISFHDDNVVYQDLSSQSLEGSKTSSAPILDTTKSKAVRLTRSVSECRQTKEMTPKPFKWRMKKGKVDLPKAKASEVRLKNDATENIADINIRTSAQGSPVKSQEPSNLTNDIASFKQMTLQNSPTKFHRNTSNMSSDNDTTSEISIVKNIPSENIFVPKTSTSGVSNNKSSFSENMAPNKGNKKVKVREVFMFGVAGQSMRDVLKTRCDEWVSRFVQIMEEILREKLQEYPPFVNKEYPPPWNLQEAARCIIKKFSENFNIVDAANKLSFILYKVSDEHDKIPENVEPKDYMEMYSYGVYLVETLQDISSNCEDLKTASDSLKKLLYDIQNDCLDLNHQDPFTDNPHELAMDETNREFDRTEIDNNSSKNGPTTDPMEIDFFESRHPASHNLQSQKSQSKTARDLNYITKEKKSAFFDSLNLKNTPGDQAEVLKEVFEELDEPTNMINTRDPITMPEQGDSPGEKQQTDYPDNNVHINDTVAAPQTKIVRQFTKFAEFEKRLKEKELDHEFYSDNEECDNYEHIQENQEQSVEIDNYEIAPVIVKDAERSKNFLRFIGRLVGRIRYVFTQTEVLCKEYVSGPKQSGRRNQLRKSVEKACLFIGTVRDSLDCIINRDPHDKENNMQRLLAIANVDDFIPDDNMCMLYRDVITKHKNQAEFCVNSLRSILKIVLGPNI